MNSGYPKKTIVDPMESVYDHVVYDFGAEARAEELEKVQDAKVYAMLLDWFKVPTKLSLHSLD
jgi:hypothetical protein